MSIAKLTSISGTQSLMRCFYLLRLIGQHHKQGISIEALSRLSELNRTTTHRMVNALCQAGLVFKAANQPVYYLGIEIVALGSMAMDQSPVVTEHKKQIEIIAKRSGASVFLSIKSGDYSHCVYYQKGILTGSTFASNLGQTRLLGLGISSISLLAALSDEEIKAHYFRHVERYRNHRMSLKRLMSWIDVTRSQGYAYINAQGVGGVGINFPLGSCNEFAVSTVIPNFLDQQRAQRYIKVIQEVMCT